MKRKATAGFTIVELVMVIALLSVLATMTFTTLGDNVDANHYAETRAKMDAIRTAILGEDTVDGEGHRTRFGYLGDMGNFPVTLSSLTTQGSQPNWAYDTFYGFGSGWRGPYLAENFSNALAVDLDAWGNSFVYTTSPIPSITSQAADKANGGVLFDKDLVMSMSTNMWMSSVVGVVSDGPLRVGTATVEIRYPVQGAQTAVTNSSTASGTYVFNTVPYGIHSLAVTGASPVPAFGPVRIVVDRQFTAVAEHSMNLAGKSKVTLSSASNAAGTVTVNISSAYQQTLTVDYIVLTHDSANTLTSVKFGAAAAEAVPNIASGVKIKPRAAFTVAPGASAITLVFSADMTPVNYFLTIYWTSVDRRDTIQFST